MLTVTLNLMSTLTLNRMLTLALTVILGSLSPTVRGVSGDSAIHLEQQMCGYIFTSPIYHDPIYPVLS